MLDQQTQNFLRAKYNPNGSILRKHQNILQQILDEIHKIAKKHDIPYWLSYGNALGAVRHGGFIPWDDDLDISIFQEDYRSFLKILKEELPKGYVVQDEDTDPYYFGPYAKVRHIGSFIHEGRKQDLNYKYRGAYVDIFPIHRSSRTMMWITGKCQNLLIYYIPKIKPYFLFRNIARGLNLILLKGLYPFMRSIAKHTKLSYRICYGSNFPYPINYESIVPLKPIIFEGKEYNGPGNLDQYLTDRYGNYMELPSQEDLHIHLTDIIIDK